MLNSFAFKTFLKNYLQDRKLKEKLWCYVELGFIFNKVI